MEYILNETYKMPKEKETYTCVFNNPRNYKLEKYEFKVMNSVYNKFDEELTFLITLAKLTKYEITYSYDIHRECIELCFFDKEEWNNWMELRLYLDDNRILKCIIFEDCYKRRDKTILNSDEIGILELLDKVKKWL